MSSNNDDEIIVSNEDETPDYDAILADVPAFELIAHYQSRADVAEIMRMTGARRVLENTIKELDGRIAAELTATEAACVNEALFTHPSDRERLPAIIANMFETGDRLDDTTGPTLSSMAGRVSTFVEANTANEDEVIVSNEDTVEGGE